MNDGLMALLFLRVTLELGRELADGHLATWSRRLLPLCAAAGGIVAPVAVYVAFTADAPTLRQG